MIKTITDLIDKYAVQVVKSYGIGWGIAATVLIVAVVALGYYFGVTQ